MKPTKKQLDIILTIESKENVKFEGDTYNEAFKWIKDQYENRVIGIDNTIHYSDMKYND